MSSEPASALSELADMLVKLKAMHEAAKARLIQQSLDLGLGLEPEEMRDHSGRFILLDSLTAVAVVQSKLMTLEHYAFPQRYFTGLDAAHDV